MKIIVNQAAAEKIRKEELALLSFFSFFFPFKALLQKIEFYNLNSNKYMCTSWVAKVIRSLLQLLFRSITAAKYFCPVLNKVDILYPRKSDIILFLCYTVYAKNKNKKIPCVHLNVA